MLRSLKLLNRRCSLHGVLCIFRRHPGCTCRGDWVGPHCELHKSALENEESFGSGGGTGPRAFEIIVLLISMIAIAVVAVFATTSYLRRRKRRRHISDRLRWNSRYRDEPDRDQVNIAPRRSSYIDEPYPANAHSSSTDPMATHLAIKKADAAVESPDEAEPQPQVYIGPPRDEDGHELHNVEII